jgi:GntR family transcriptional regulator
VCSLNTNSVGELTSVDLNIEEASRPGFLLRPSGNLEAKSKGGRPTHSQRQRLAITTAEQLRAALLSGTWHWGQQLPAEPVLAKTIGVSRTTLREALRMLEEEGLLVRRHGAGSFSTVNPGRIAFGLERLETFVSAVVRLGYRAEDRVLDLEACEIQGAAAESLGLPPGSLGWHTKSIVLADDIPVIYCDDIIPAWLVPDRPKVEKRWSKPLLELLSEDLCTHVRYVFHTIGAASAEGEVIDHLGCPGMEPLVTLTGLGFADGERPVYLSKSYIRANNISLTLIRR